MTIPDEVDIIVAGGMHSSAVITQKIVAHLISRGLRWLCRSRPPGCTRPELDCLAD